MYWLDILFFFLQTKLINVAESISSKLSYFTELDKIGTRLSSPAFSVTSDSFLPLLTRLDECISFTEKNVSVVSMIRWTLFCISFSFVQMHYKESQLYLTRFKQYLQRSLGLVKQHVDTLRTTTASILPKPVSPILVAIISVYTNIYIYIYTNINYLTPLYAIVQIIIFQGNDNNRAYLHSF